MPEEGERERGSTRKTPWPYTRIYIVSEANGSGARMGVIRKEHKMTHAYVSHYKRAILYSLVPMPLPSYISYTHVKCISGPAGHS